MRQLEMRGAQVPGNISQRQAEQPDGAIPVNGPSKGAIDQQCGGARLQTAERVHYLRYQVLGLFDALKPRQNPARSRLHKRFPSIEFSLPIEAPQGTAERSGARPTP